MVVSLTDTKRAAIAEKLASMKEIQQLIINNEQNFVRECPDPKLRDRLEDMLEDDQKNLGVIETTITQYGVRNDPKETVQKMVERAQEMMHSSHLSLYEKVAQHELLKHGQVMSGLVVHQAAKVVGKDVEAAIAPLNTVNFENRAHQEQLKGMLEYLGTRELTGEEPDQSVWGRVQDAVAALSGVLGGAVTQTSDKSDLSIMDIIFMDHQKTKTLISEIRNTDDPNKIQEYFGQLYKDLIVHSKAEEQVVYPAVRSFYGERDTQELYDEQAELEQVLKQTRNMQPGSSEFCENIKTIKHMVGDHTRQEESTMFAAIRKNCSKEQQERLATQFKEVKKQLQNQM